MKPLLCLSAYILFTASQAVSDDMFDWGDLDQEFIQKAAKRGNRINIVRG